MSRPHESEEIQVAEFEELCDDFLIDTLVDFEPMERFENKGGMMTHAWCFCAVTSSRV